VISESLVVENGLPLYPDRGLNFNLPSPSINTSASIANTQLPNQSAVKPLVIRNTGQGQLDWNIFEFLPPTLRQPARLTAPEAITTSFAEGFNDITTLVGNGWARTNNSNPLGSTAWFQGNPAVFVSQSGATNSYIGANYNNTGGVGTISNWLLTPEVQLNNGTKITFWTRVPTNSQYPDRLEVRLSTSGGSTDVGASETSVGVFTTTLLSINPNLVVGGYPDTWTVYTVTVSGLPAPTTGRFGFRYFVTDGGQTGSNSNYIGIDTFNYVTLPAPCQYPIDVPWMNVSPTGGSTLAGGSSTVSVTLNSTGLVSGTYNALVCISSNDPANPTVQVPVTLNVVSSLKIYLPLIRR
jgi:hypothetical protein